MPSRLRLGSVLLASVVALGPLSGCSGSADSDDSNITDVKHTPVERQSIGNCWLYAEATWVESMHLSATGQEFDTSQSYWTYWSWLDRIGRYTDEIETGGEQWTAARIIRDRGLVPEVDFVPE